MLTRITGISSEGIQPVLGFLGASLSATAIWLADASQTLTPEAQGWVQLGGTIGLITFLVYACRTLWMALQDARTATTNALAAATATATAAAEAVAHAVETAEARMAAERAAFIAAKEALEREIRTDWKKQNDELIQVLRKLDPDKK